MILASLIVRLRALVGRRRHEAELAEELRYHLDREIERNQARGLDPEAARAAALRGFGNVGAVQDTVRTGWGWLRLGEVRQDLRFALKTFRREPFLVATVVLTVGLGVGLNTAFFTIFNTYFFKPLPVADPKSLYDISWNDPDRQRRPFTPSQYRELSRQPVIAESFGYRNILVRIDRRQSRAALVTGDFFRVLGIGPALGRVLDSADAGAPVAVLSHRAWQVHFGSDPGVLGRSMQVHGHPVEIVGVAPAGFEGTDEALPEFWAPVALTGLVGLSVDPLGVDGRDAVGVIARFRPGVSPAAGGAAVERWLRGTTTDRLPTDRIVGVRIASKATVQELSPQVFRAIAPILVALGLVLLAACANVASAMVARGAARQRELAVRLALGAGRGRIVRQLLTENLLLALPAAASGLLLSRLLLLASSRFMAETMPSSFQAVVAIGPLDPDYRVLGFATAVAFLSAALFGLVPALQSTRSDIIRAARDGIGLRPSRLRRALVIGQITIAALLLVAAGVLIRSAQRTQAKDLGLETTGVVALNLDDRFRAQVLDRLRSTTSVHAIAAADQIPMEGRVSRISAFAEDSTMLRVASIAVSPDFFRTLSIDLVAGRTFLETEGRSAPVAIVNQAAARALWRGGKALDRSLRLGSDSAGAGLRPASDGKSVRVVGVVEDAVSGWIGGADHEPAVYLPLALAQPGARILIRADGPSETTVRLLDRDLARIDPSAVDELHTMDETVAFSMWPLRAAYWFAVLVGAVALVFTLTGVYGVLAFVVVLRTREIGIRSALGAGRGKVVSLIVGESLQLAAIGIGAGLVLAAALSMFVASRIEAIQRFEPLAYLGGAAAVLLACVLGAVIPSRRAARVEPLQALRAE